MITNGVGKRSRIITAILAFLLAALAVGSVFVSQFVEAAGIYTSTELDSDTANLMANLVLAGDDNGFDLNFSLDNLTGITTGDSTYVYGKNNYVSGNDGETYYYNGSENNPHVNGYGIETMVFTVSNLPSVASYGSKTYEDAVILTFSNVGTISGVAVDATITIDLTVANNPGFSLGNSSAEYHSGHESTGESGKWEAQFLELYSADDSSGVSMFICNYSNPIKSSSGTTYDFSANRQCTATVDIELTPTATEKAKGNTTINTSNLYQVQSDIDTYYGRGGATTFGLQGFTWGDFYWLGTSVEDGDWETFYNSNVHHGWEQYAAISGFENVIYTFPAGEYYNASSAVGQTAAEAAYYYGGLTKVNGYSYTTTAYPDKTFTINGLSSLEISTDGSVKTQNGNTSGASSIWGNTSSGSSPTGLAGWIFENNSATGAVYDMETDALVRTGVVVPVEKPANKMSSPK